jgi:hypothetical protein
MGIKSVKNRYDEAKITHNEGDVKKIMRVMLKNNEGEE